MGNCFGVQEPDGSDPKNPSTTPPSNVKNSSEVDSPHGNTSGASSSSGDMFPRTSNTKRCSDKNLHAFSFSDLKAATRTFNPESLLGEGGFGPVYKGHIDEQTFMPTRAGQGMMIAVKKLNLKGVQGHKEWLTEVHYLGEFHHENLVKLLGFCAEDEHRLLVYEFMPRGSLENHLFFRKGHALSWAVRMKIAVGAARGLAFLHHAHRPVIYRDFKASNILLDSLYNAKLSDFGLAKDGPTGDNTHVTTRVMGTFGYAAPEYVATGHLSAKSDVYSFGVVLLEIVTGRRVMDKNRPVGEQNLLTWAEQFLTDKRKVGRIVDHRLEGQYSLKGVQMTADVALRCLDAEAKNRPTMQEVVESLEPLVNLRELSKYIDTNNENGENGGHGVKPKVINKKNHPYPVHGISRQGNGVSPYQSPKAGGFVERRQ